MKPNPQKAKKMLDQLRTDFFSERSGMLGHINIPDYKKKYNVSDYDIEAYCSSLPMLQPVYPKCVCCGGEWQTLEKKIRPINNGQILDWYHSFTMWCCGSPTDINEDFYIHDTIDYYQNDKGECSFDREVLQLNGFELDIKWNCFCGVDECYKKNVIYEVIPAKYYNDSKLIKLDHKLPFNASRKEIWDAVKINLLFG